MLLQLDSGAVLRLRYNTDRQQDRQHTIQHYTARYSHGSSLVERQSHHDNLQQRAYSIGNNDTLQAHGHMTLTLLYCKLVLVSRIYRSSSVPKPSSRLGDITYHAYQRRQDMP